MPTPDHPFDNTLSDAEMDALFNETPDPDVSVRLTLQDLHDAECAKDHAGVEAIMRTVLRRHAEVFETEDDGISMSATKALLIAKFQHWLRYGPDIDPELDGNGREEERWEKDDRVA